jgi:hypothetical protein
VRVRIKAPAVVALIVAVSVAGLAFASPASAATSRAYTGIAIGPDGIGGSETFQNVQSVAVDQSDGSIYALELPRDISESGGIYKFDATGAPSDFSALGSNHIDGISGFSERAEAEIAVAPAGSPGGTEGFIYLADNTTSITVFEPTGAKLGELESGEETCGVATDPAGHVFVGSYPSTIREFTPSGGLLTAADKTGESTGVVSEICNVAADGLGNIYAASYDGKTLVRLEGIGDSEPAPIEPAGAPIAVDPASNSLYADRGDSIAVYGRSGEPEGEFGSGRLSESLGVAVDSSTDEAYVSDRGTGTVKFFGPPMTFPRTEPATGVRIDATTLHGTVFPEGRQYTACRFEYGLEGNVGFEHVSDCEPEAAQILADSEPHLVSLSLTGLQPNSDYKFRVVATNSAGTAEGQTLKFNTVGPPRITEVLARDADQDSATLEATVDPRGVATSYRIEWGPTASYGNVAATGTLGAVAGPTAVSTQIVGLSSASTYHYRVIATSDEGGETRSTDQQVETLNACGFTDGRCLELVSRLDKGTVASPGKLFFPGSQIEFQAAPGGSALAYTTVFGYPEATVGDAAVYLGRRGSNGWNSEQLSPPTLASPGAGAINGRFNVLSPDLGCGVVESYAPLAPGAPASIVEAGGTNLFRRDGAGGSYSVITSLPPSNPPVSWQAAAQAGATYEVIGMSPDCGRIVFRGPYRYPGIPSVDDSSSQLYEWDRGTLRNVAVIPGPGGLDEPVPTEAIPGAMDENPESGKLGGKSLTDYWHAISANGTRSIFTAVSRFGGDLGRRALFLRDVIAPGVQVGNVPATDVSQSETATANDGNSRYWTSSSDGNRIFFTARYGLAANGSSSGATGCVNAPYGGLDQSSGEGCDLYEYDVDAPVGEHLTDLSADTVDPAGAGVAGVLDTSEDGSHVYFVARGRLGGAGRTEADNLGAGTFNVYLASAGTTRFVGLLGEGETVIASNAARALVNVAISGGEWTSRSSPDGETLAFESSLGVPGEVSEVYLYSASAGSVVCASCRHDGLPPSAEHRLPAMIGAAAGNPEEELYRPVVLTANGRVYFYSYDPLAPGAVEGDRNLYQWEHGQVSLIAVEPATLPRAFTGDPSGNFFGGASTAGGDVYFATPESLIGTDRDGRWDVYDAREGGGFPEPPPAAPPCDAVVEGACNPGSSPEPNSTAPATTGFTGPSNPSAKKKNEHAKKKHHKRKHHKKPARRGHKHTVKAGNPGRAGGDRRAGI